MRGLLLALLFLAPLLSGCLMPQPPGPADAPGAGEEALRPVVPLDVRAQNGAQGFWVAPGADRLVLQWTQGTARTDADDKTQRSADVHDDRPNGVLSHFDDLLIVLGPDNDRLHVGTPSFRLYTADSTGPAPSANGTLSDQAPGVFLDITDPAPGLYRLITFGDLPLPHVTVEDPNAEDTLLIPLPLTVTRTTLLAQTGPVAGALEGSGALALAPGTVAIWGGLHGVGSDARLDIQNEDGQRIAHVRSTLLADPHTAGAGPYTFGITRFFDEWSAEPADLLGPTAQWTVTGTGTGIAYAYAAVVGDLPRPPVRLGDADNATVPLEGRLRPNEAGGFILPADAQVVVHRATSSSEYRDHVSFRIYDATGTRLYTGTTTDAATPVGLPAGPLAIVNDGPGDLEVSVAGNLPDDAALHPLETTTKTYRARLGSPTDGAAETALRAAIDGPVTRIAYYATLGTLEELYVQVHRQDGTAVQSLPDRAAYGPQSTPCCSPPVLGGDGAYARWIDPGIHHIHLRSEAGEGDVVVETRIIALQDLLALTEGEERDDN